MPNIQKMKKFNCAQCNKEFELYLKPSSRKQENYYCCRRCYELSKKRNINTKCKQCNKEFEIGCLEKPFKYFCCDICEEIYKNNNHHIIKNCEQCNKEIIIFKAGMKNKDIVH